MSSTMESLTINCILCKGKIGASNGGSSEMYYDKDLAFLLNFLADEEVGVLVRRMGVRMNLF